MISKSPQRYQFQKQSYIQSTKEAGKEVDQQFLDIFEEMEKKESDKFLDPENRKNNLEWDLRTTDWILEKARGSESYAQNIYAALCNNGFVKLDVIQILKEQEWSCSWRFAGGIVADMRQEGDYIDWYCSGMRGGCRFDLDEEKLTEEQKQRLEITNRYAPEGKITKEIREDFRKLGWVPTDDGDWKNFDE